MPRFGSCLACLLLVTGCGASPDGAEDEQLGQVEQPVVSAPLPAAHCQINVTGKGTKSMEDDYLPHVITCENGGASLEALKAQAIAARSVAYYNIATQGSICDGQGCQVYSCGAAPQAKHYQAVKETAGMYLSYAGLLTYGFYVAGDSSTGGAYCVGSSGSTEKYVTYNWGKTGGAVKQTSLGYIGPPGFGQNRGCMGQWGARCLESHGFGYMDILRFYYGSDIQVLKASGPCVKSCTPHCEGSKIVSSDCGVGDCAVYGATCVDDNLGVRCASVFCPAQGQKKVCVNDKLVGDCKDGAISTGDCSVYGSVCKDDAKGARCVFVFCADQPTQAHDVCLPNGQLAHCSDVGGVSVEDCPANKPCTQTASGAQCGAPSGGSPGAGGAGAGGEAGEAGAGGGAGEEPGAGQEPGSGGQGGFGSLDDPASSQKTRRVAEEESGCSVSRRSSGSLPVFLLALSGVLFVRRRSHSARGATKLSRVSRWSFVWLVVLLSSTFGCSVASVDESHDADEQCEAPTLQETAQELSSIDCNQHGDTGYSSGNPFPITVVTVDGKPVEKSTANAYYVMAQAAAAAGVNLKIVSGFRTMSEQQYLYNCYVNCNCNNCNLAAKPGYSNHQSGHALDLNTSSPGVYNWLLANAGAFGFKKTVPSENWHWEWWGGGPGGGPCGSCKAHCEGSKIIGQDCGVGDCAVYGATCVDDAKGVRCASVFCPTVGQKKVCINDKLIGDCNDGAISSGDCSVYGATCVDDAKGARCVSVFCPATGQKKVCINDKLIGDCNDGAISSGDCSVYGSACVDDAKGARCVFAFCSDKPTEAHDVCLPNGQLAHCNDLGGVSIEDCPANEPCTASAGGAQCGAAPSPTAPAPGSAGGAGSSTGGSGGASAGGGWSTGGAPIKSASGGGAGRDTELTEPVRGGCACSLPGGSPSSGLFASAGIAALALLSFGRRRRG